jgi:hypothetical protein
MVIPDQLPVGKLVTVQVIGHQQWGVEVRVLPPEPDLIGVIDVLYVTNKRPFAPIIDYPIIGHVTRAVVMPSPANGQLRLSTRDSDISRALEAISSDEV